MAQETEAPLPERISVYLMLMAMTDQLSAMAFQKMGLQPGMDGKIAQDLPEAKVAIDAAASLIKLMEPALDDEDRRHVQNLVRDLRLNFVNQTQDAANRGGAPALEGES